MARKYNRARGWLAGSRRWDWLITVRRGARDVTGRARVAIGRGRRVEDPTPSDRVAPLVNAREIPGEGGGEVGREVFSRVKSGDEGRRGEESTLARLIDSISRCLYRLVFFPAACRGQKSRYLFLRANE